MPTDTKMITNVHDQPIRDLDSKFIWRVVSDDLRSKTDILEDAMVKELLRSKTIEVDNWPKSSNLYRALRNKGYKLRTRALNENTTILWLERLEHNAGDER